MKLFQKLINLLKQFKSQPIKFPSNGKTIDLTGDNIIINSTNFSVDENGNMKCNNGQFQGDIQISYENAITVTDSDENKYMVFDAGGIGFYSDNIQTGCIVRTYSSGNEDGISLKTTTDNSYIAICKYNDVKFEYSASEDKIIFYDIPKIYGTASGTIFSGLGGNGGISVDHGIITDWDLSTTWTGTYYLNAGNTSYKVTVHHGLMTGIEQV